MNTSRFSAASVMLTAAVLASGCAPTSADTAESVDEVIDNCGHDVVIPDASDRILSVKSSTFELLLELGVEDRLVGVAYPDGPVAPAYSEAAANIPVISDKVPSREAVLDLRPDMVVAGWESNFSADGAGERGTLESFGVTTYVASPACTAAEYRPNPLTFDKVFDYFTELGELVGEPDAATELVTEQRAQLESLTADNRGLTAVWYSSGGDQPYIGGGIGAPAMIMAEAGLDNAFADVDESWFSSSWEQFATTEPDVIVLVDAEWNTAASKIETLKANPLTQTLTAVAQDRFIILDFPETEAGVRNVDAVKSTLSQLNKL